MTMTPEQASWFADIFTRLVDNAEQVLLGKSFVVRLAYTAFLSEGHLLLEDYPGTGKTSLARAMAQTVDGSSSRACPEWDRGCWRPSAGSASRPAMTSRWW